MSKKKIKTGAKVSPIAQMKKEKPAIDADIQNLLGRKLCDSYKELVEEEVPVRFLDLLRELKSKEDEGKEDEGKGGDA